jgi:N-acetylmuramoyl-L-alanine amidase
MNYSLWWLPKALRDAGLNVIEVPGWQTRGHGDMGTVRFIICHHTAEVKSTRTKPTLSILLNGRPDLQGPLCNLALGQDGTFYMVAAGKAWHAGAGLWRGISDGNGCAVGIEAKNDGVGEIWPAVQIDSYAKGCAAILKYIKAAPDMVCGHKEYALPHGRKPDPNFDMNLFRQRVAKFMTPKSTQIAQKGLAPSKAPVAPAPVPQAVAASPIATASQTSRKVEKMNTNMLGGVFRAIVPPMLAFLIARGIIPAGNYDTVITAVMALATAVWSMQTNKAL